jgi:RNA polymerase sigma-70 factor, ECF subfamily
MQLRALRYRTVEPVPVVMWLVELVYWHPGRAADWVGHGGRACSGSDSAQGLGRFMWPDASETQNLLHRVAQADASATDELWERYRPALRRMIGLRLDQAVSRRVDASDVVQDVLIKASQRLAEYLRNPVLPFHLWLRQIARDHVIDAHRRHRGSARRSVDRERGLPAQGADASCDDRSSLDLAAQLRDSGLTPAAIALRRELQSRFDAVLLRLDEGDREIILLRHFEQLSNSEAAQALGLSEAAAGMRHVRALRRLRALLGETPSLCG